MELFCYGTSTWEDSIQTKIQQKLSKENVFSQNSLNLTALLEQLAYYLLK